MPRMSIYVPDDMKARMDKAGEGANWSAIAQRAFTVELNHLESIKEISSMSDVVERLRASKERLAADHGAQMRDSGKEWAKNVAEYDELKRIADIDLDDFKERYDHSGSECVEGVYKIVMQEDPASHLSQLSDFYLVDDDLVPHLTNAHVEGFIEGAQDVWREVEDRI